MGKSRNILATRYYEVPKDMTNEDIAEQMSHGNRQIFLRDGNSFVLSPDSGLFGFRCLNQPGLFALVTGTPQDVYGKAERLFRQLSDQEADEYEAGCP